MAALGDGVRDLSVLTGNGALVLTIDQGAHMSRYQGVVPLEGVSLAEAAHTYFMQSEQIPTRVRLSVGEERLKGETGSHWRAAGFLIQHLPEAGQAVRDLPPGDDPSTGEPVDYAFDEADEWREAEALFGTLEDHELLDETLSSQQLLYRLFHERGVKVYEETPLTFACQCSKERITAVFEQFSNDDLEDMIDNDKVGVTCEFCNTHYEFARAEIEALKK